MIALKKKYHHKGKKIDQNLYLRPLDLRVSVTEKCNLSCIYCRRKSDLGCGSSPSHPLQFSQIAALAAILMRYFNLRKVHLTGGEPLMRTRLEQLVSMLAEIGVKDIAMTTNANALLPVKAATLRNAGLRRVNISLDSLSATTYKQMTCGGELRETLRGIDAALEAGFTPVKLNTVVVRGVNDNEIFDLLEFAISKRLELRFIELMPIGVGSKLFSNGFVSSAELLEKLKENYSPQALQELPGASARLYKISSPSGGKGTVGFISSCSMPFCSECARLRLTAEGRLLGCLARNFSISAQKLIRSKTDSALVEKINTLLKCKRAGNSFQQNMQMIAIGG